MANRRKARKLSGRRGGAAQRPAPPAGGTGAVAAAPASGGVRGASAVAAAPARGVERFRREPAAPRREPAPKAVFLGFALDADEREASVREKRLAWDAGVPEVDPYTAVLERLALRHAVPLAWNVGIRELGCVNLPPWLRPMPPASQAESNSASAYAAFVDAGGCLTAAAMVSGLIEEHVLPDIPCLVTVEHSLTGGAISALSAWLGPENLSVVVLDAHTDAIPVSVTAGAIHYDAETNPSSVYSLDDPLLHERGESYNASSFLHYLLAQGFILPANLYLLGVADYPPSRAFRLEDPRMARYTGAYSHLKKRGVKILTRDDIMVSPGRVDWELGRITTPYVYVSVDLDVGSGAALQGVRFREREGLPPAALESLAGSLGRLVHTVELAGLDVSELNPRTAGPGPLAPDDCTYDFACLFLEALLGERLTETAFEPWKGER